MLRRFPPRVARSSDHRTILSTCHVKLQCYSASMYSINESRNSDTLFDSCDGRLDGGEEEHGGEE